MAHGTPDYGVTSGAFTVYQVKDLGELAARLGSPITFDRRGDVLWWDDFECGLAKWSDTGAGTGKAVALSTARARNGRTSCLLTAGSDGGRTGQISHSRPFTALSAIGLEASFSLPGAVERINVTLQIELGTARYDASVRWNGVSNTIEYVDAGGAAVTLESGVILRQDPTLFHTFKVVADMAAGQYVRAIVDEKVYALPGIAAFAGVPSGELSVVAHCRVIGRAGVNDTVYVDDVIVTQNEPV
jgi:hypothetical protein